MTVDQFFSLLISLTPDFFIKLFLIVLGIFYFIFTFVIYRQISLMSQTVQTILSPLLKLVAIVQMLAVAVLVFLVFIFV